MSEQPTAPSAAPLHVVVAFRRLGISPEELAPGTTYWRLPSGRVVRWEQAHEWVVDRAVEAQQAPVKDPFWKSGRFYVVLSAIAASWDASKDVLTAQLAALPPPYNQLLGGTAMLVGGALARYYIMDRREQDRLMHERIVSGRNADNDDGVGDPVGRLGRGTDPNIAVGGASTSVAINKLPEK